jgi:hypothetical protein
VLEAICSLPDKESFDKAIAYEKTYDAIIKRIPNDDWDKGIYEGYTTQKKRDFAELTKAFLQTFKKSVETYQEQKEETAQIALPPQKEPVQTTEQPKEPITVQQDLFTDIPIQPVKIVSASERKETKFYQPNLPGMENY